MRRAFNAIYDRNHFTAFFLDFIIDISLGPLHVARSVTRLDHIQMYMYIWVTVLIPLRSHTFVEIYHAFISTVIHFHSADSFKKGCLP